MYKVVSVENYEMTRSIELENLETGTVDRCFDDSSLVSDENFEFMNLNDEYNCKIKLFGNVVQDREGAVRCIIDCREVKVGTKK